LRFLAAAFDSTRRGALSSGLGSTDYSDNPVHDPIEPLKLRSEQLAWREIEGEAVVLDLRSGTYLSVNVVGRMLWTQLADGATPAELYATVAEAFEIDPATAREDVNRFLTDLTERGLLA
jgi:hypothetical protein